MHILTFLSAVRCKQAAGCGLRYSWIVSSRCFCFDECLIYWARWMARAVFVCGGGGGGKERRPPRCLLWLARLSRRERRGGRGTRGVGMGEGAIINAYFLEALTWGRPLERTNIGTDALAADWTHARTHAHANAGVLHFRLARTQTLIHADSHTHQRKPTHPYKWMKTTCWLVFFFFFFRVPLSVS